MLFLRKYNRFRVIVYDLQCQQGMDAISGKHLQKFPGSLCQWHISCSDQYDFTCGHFFGQMDLEKFFLLMQAVIRNKGKPQTDIGQIQQDIVGIQFDLRHQFQLFFAEGLVL